MPDLSWAAGLDHPRALAISPILSTAFPLARHVGAIWVDRIHSQLVARYTRFARRIDRTGKNEIPALHEQDLKWILRQIEDKAPDIIIQDVSPGNFWLSSELLALKPEFLEGYEVIAEEGGIRVLGRKLGARHKFPDRPL